MQFASCETKSGGRLVEVVCCCRSAALTLVFAIVLAPRQASGQTAAQKPSQQRGRVSLGIDQLEATDFAAVKLPGKGTTRVGLVTNQTGVDSTGRRTIDVLAHAKGLQLTAIFSPEHGVQGTADTTEIDSSKDGATGVPVYSVYGGTDAKRRPQPEQLRDVDVIVFDLQDVGVRFYTYETTLGYFLEAAAKLCKPMVVLDRPNPINGVSVQGPVSDAGHESFVNYQPLPVRHGMTIGELAKLFNAERGINAKLTVVPMQGWQREQWFDSAGLAWISPSPNLLNLQQATLYPGVALIEFANVSVGRGTDTPFELVGAPWVNTDELAKYLNARKIEAVRFVPVRFTPTASNYAKQQCSGVKIVVVNREVVDTPLLGIELASALRKLYPQQFDMSRINALLVNQMVFEGLQKGEDPRRLADGWRDGVRQFMQVRGKHLLY